MAFSTLRSSTTQLVQGKSFIKKQGPGLFSWSYRAALEHKCQVMHWSLQNGIILALILTSRSLGSFGPCFLPGHLRSLALYLQGM